MSAHIANISKSMLAAVAPGGLKAILADLLATEKPLATDAEMAIASLVAEHAEQVTAYTIASLTAASEHDREIAKLYLATLAGQMAAATATQAYVALAANRAKLQSYVGIGLNALSIGIKVGLSSLPGGGIVGELAAPLVTNAIAKAVGQ